MDKFYFFIFLLFIFSQNTYAQLQVYPTRVFLNQRTTSSHLNIKNTTDLVQSYKVDLKFYKMKKTGDYIEVRDDEENKLSLKKYIKFSPQEVVLEPNSQQTVRLMLVDHEKLSLPEYYVHIYFVPNNKVSKSETAIKNNFSLQGKVAIAIPVLFRNGDVKYQPHIDNIKARIDKSGDITFSGVLKNSNNTFFYGQFEIYKIKNTTEELIATLKGISSYIPEKNINWVIKKSDFEDKKYEPTPNDSLKIVLKNDPDDMIDFKNEISFKITN